MLDEGPAGLGTAGQQVDDAVRHTRRTAQFDEPHRGHRGLFRGFDDHRVPAGEGRCDLPTRDHEREVPRGDQRAHSHRLALGVLQHAGDGHWRRLAVDLGDPAGVVAEVLGSRGDADRHGDAERLALVAGLQLGQFLGVFLDEVADAPQDAGALGRGESRPVRVLEGGAGGPYGRVGVRGPARDTWAWGCPVAGSRVSNSAPEAAACHSPPMKRVLVTAVLPG